MTFLTTRFTDETWAENQRYRDTHLVPCVYGLGVPISDKHPHSPLYILEMNNSTNQLLGIGIMTKKIHPRVQIYANPYYNRYIYKGNHYIPRDKIPEEIREEHLKIMVEIKGEPFKCESVDMTVWMGKPEDIRFMISG